MLWRGGWGGAAVLLPLLVVRLRNQFQCHTAPYPSLPEPPYSGGDDDYGDCDDLDSQMGQYCLPAIMQGDQGGYDGNRGVWGVGGAWV